MEIFKHFNILVRIGVVLNLLNQSYAFGLGLIATLVEGIFYRLNKVEIILVELEGVLLEFGQIEEIADKI